MMDNESKQNENELKNTQEPDNKKDDSEGNYMTLGMCIGMCLGISIGQLLFDNMATGLSVGTCLGLAVGICIKKKK